MFQKPMMTVRYLTILLLLALLSTGCNTITRRAPRMPWQDKDEEEYAPPAKLVAIWKDQVYSPAGERPTRGFGGRVYFYDAASKPVRVRGTLKVYAFDDDNKEKGDPDKPDRKYVFEAEELQEHYSMSKIGHSYSFWIPWDVVGGEQRSITLAPYFQGEKGGGLVAGDQSRTVLPGRPKSPSELNAEEAIPPGMPQSPYYAQPASYMPPNQQQYQQQPQYQQQQPQTQYRQQLRTTTIPVPTTLEQRLLMQNETGMPQRQVAPPYRPFPTERQLPVNQQSAVNQQPELGPNQAVNFQNAQFGMRNGGGIHSGVNLQTYQPDFHNSSEYNQYLATGSRPTGEAAVEQYVTRSVPPLPPAPSSHIAPPVRSYQPSQPTQSTWPQGLPSSPQR